MQQFSSSPDSPHLPTRRDKNLFKGLVFMDIMSEQETITIDKTKVINFFKNPRVSWGITIAILLFLILTSYGVRTSNVPLLKDGTSGETIPLALDPFYFMRISETYLANDGVMPEHDAFRYNPVRQTPWHNEINPYLIANLYTTFSNVGLISMPFRDFYVITPALFFVCGLIIFFFLSYFLTKNKWLALLASAFLAYTPAYLYRTMAGFADHESIGMATYFLVLLAVVISLKNIGRKKDPSWKPILFGALTGLALTFNMATWKGISNTLLIIFPICFLLIWLFNTKKENKPFAVQFIIYYITWIVSSILFSPLFTIPMKNTLSTFKVTEGLLTIGVLAFIIIDYFLKNQKSIRIEKKYQLLYSIGATIILGFIGLTVIGRSLLDVLSSIIGKLITPFGRGRFGTTVAENQAPYLSQWISQTGGVLFWFFIFGTFLFGYQLSKKVKGIKEKILLFVLYVAMIVGIVFSKYSQSSPILNGESTVSILFYFIPLIAFWLYFIYVYVHNEIKWSKNDAFIFGWLFFTIISGRAALRMFFAITPFVCFMAAYFIINLVIEYKKSKDKTFRLVIAIFFIISIFLSAQFLNISYQSIAQGAKVTGPSANIQWQQAMNWVRTNTPKGSVFVHWWDYGYWVESLGERPSVADGGHFQGSADGNHKIGRYVLTTPNPQTAHSYFKTMNISYLLIDPTELGKYSAYSRIGSDDNWDRFSVIPAGTYDPRNIQETNNETIYIYNVQTGVDEDFSYTLGGKEEFFPGPTYDVFGTPTFKSYLGGVFVKMQDGRIAQPEAAFFKNNQQYNVPVRYVYANEQLFDFNTGIDAVISIIPSIRGQQIDPIGGVIYLSPKVSKSLYAQVYLLDDAFGSYPTLNLSHVEDAPIIASIKSQNPGVQLSEFLYYNGLQGPIKIWQTNYPENTTEVPAFYEPFNGAEEGFGSLDRYFE